MTCASSTRRPIMVDAVMASLHIQHTYRVTIKPTTIRQWASRKKIRTHHLGRMRYDLREVEKYAVARGLIAK